jgi:predicted DNA-binding transcriptional regulator AlpA
MVDIGSGSAARECGARRESVERGVDRLIRWREVERLTGLSRGTASRMTAAGDFPASRRYRPYAWVAWSESEVLAWVDARIALPAA